MSRISTLKDEKDSLEENLTGMKESNQTLNNEKAVLTDKLSASEGVVATQKFQIKTFETELGSIREEKNKMIQQHQEQFKNLNEKYMKATEELTETKANSR